MNTWPHNLWVFEYMATYLAIVKICVIVCRVTVFFSCMRIWVIDLNVKKNIAAFLVLTLWQLLALTFTCIYLGVSPSILHVLLYHIAALVLQSFSCCILEDVNNFCLLGICEFHVIPTSCLLAFNELAYNMKCVLWIAFYCIFLSAFCWLMYWVSGSFQMWDWT